MRIKFYDITYKIKENKIYNGKAILIGEYDYDRDKGNVIDFAKYYKENYLYYQKPFKNLEIDKTYYMIANDTELFGVICLYKGFTFIDCMEHDDRVIVKSAFPYLKCYIIGEIM